MCSWLCLRFDILLLTLLLLTAPTTASSSSPAPTAAAAAVYVPFLHVCIKVVLCSCVP
jgi:hypothetical protein